MARDLTRDMTSGNPTLLILKFAIPMLIGNLFQQLYSLVDAMVVGNYVGQDAIAAIGASGPLNYFIFGLILGIITAVSIVISQYFGAKDMEHVKKSFVTGTYIIFGVAIVLGITGIITSRWLLELLRTPDSIIDQSTIYMRITYLGIIGMAGYNGIAFVLRALGDTITPLIFLVSASILNVALDLIFVIFFNWGVPGVALATILSQAVAATGCIFYAFKKLPILRITASEFKPDKVIFNKCIKLGVPLALHNSFVSISTMALQGIINGYGEVVIAAATIVSRIEQLAFEPGCSVGIAVASFTGQNIGAGRIDRVKKGFYAATKIIIIFSLIMIPLMYFGGEKIMMLFTKEGDIKVVEVGIQAIRVTSLFYILVGMIFITRFFLSGAGDTKIPMLMGFTEVVCRVVFTCILSSRYGCYGIWWATALNWLVTSMVGILRYASGRWKNKSIVKVT